MQTCLNCQREIDEDSKECPYCKFIINTPKNFYGEDEEDEMDH